MKKSLIDLVIVVSFVFLFQLSFSTPIGRIVWKCDVGPSLTSPAIASNGTIYVGDLEGYMCAVSPNGTIKWKYKTDAPILSSPTIGKDGTLYFVNNDEFLYALKSNGTLKWRRRIAYGIISNMIFSVSVGKYGRLYVGNDYSLYSFDKNGDLIWKKELSERINTSPSIGEDGTVYVGTESGTLYAISSNGKTKWKFSAGGKIISDISIDKNGVIYFGDSNGYLYAVNENGTLDWSFNAQKAVYLPVSTGKSFVGDVVYLACGNSVYCIDENGLDLWTYHVKGNFSISSTVVGRNSNGLEYVYFAYGNSIYSLTSYGSESWSLPFETEILSLPAMLNNGDLCITSMGGYLYAIKTASLGLANSLWPKFHGRYGNENSYFELNRSESR